MWSENTRDHENFSTKKGHPQTYQEWCFLGTVEQSRCTRCNQETPEFRSHPSLAIIIIIIIVSSTLIRWNLDIFVCDICLWCCEIEYSFPPESFPKERGLLFLFGPLSPVEVKMKINDHNHHHDDAKPWHMEQFAKLDLFPVQVSSAPDLKIRIIAMLINSRRPQGPIEGPNLEI